ERLLALRRYKNLEVLRIGMNDINGALRSEETTEQLTLLAEVCLGKVYDLVCEAVAGRFGPPRFRVGAGGEVRAGSLAILALGRLGQGELSYSSDLDLIFLYDLGEEVPEAEGGCARLSPHAYFTKIAQRMISALSLPSEEGFLYRIDTRLRPSGNAGPLVTSREAFLAYHTQGQARVAQNWEKLALLKARAVAGDRRLGARIVSIVQETLYGMNPDATVLSDLEAMRSRIEKELAREDRSRYNVKTGRGGLVDIEFMVQMLQRSQGGRYAALRTTSIREALRHLSETKYFSSTDQRFLEEAYDFLRRLEHALRIVHDRPIDDLTCLADNLDQIAARMGYRGSRKEGGGSALLARYREVTHGVRRCYEATLRKLRNDLPRGVEEQGMGA
ncbi:MAG: bifunctional [glutamate--ammonia ligase]-adenylyl-L-tyrosine phosphorylase/[glutamate--ammonia-ligase] adenylyltransferase, partial [Deltaproteobacteria bacterium]